MFERFSNRSERSEQEDAECHGTWKINVSSEESQKNAFDEKVRSFAEEHGIPISIANTYLSMQYTGKPMPDPKEFARTACRDGTFKEPMPSPPKYCDLLNRTHLDDTKSTDTGSKYLRTIVDKTDPSKSVTTDLYGIISGLQMPFLGDDGADAALHHCLKKICYAGERGHKDTLTDLKEAAVSLQRAIELAKVKV